MDEKLGSAFIEVRLDNKKLNADLNKLKGRIGKIDKSYNKAGKGAEIFGNKTKTSFKKALKESVSLERTTKRLAFLFTVGLAYSAVRGIKSFVSNSIGGFIDLEKQVAKVTTMISGNTEKMTNTIKTQLRSMAFSFAQTTKAVSESYYNILSSSFEVSEAMDVMRASALAATAGMTDLGTSTKVITGILNSYGYESERAYDVSDKLFAMVKRGVFTFEDLAQNLGKVAPIAAQMGVSLEELGAGITTTTRQGLKLRETTTSLNRLFTAFAKPTKEAVKVAKEFGINLNATYLQAYGLTGILEKLNGITEEQLVTFGMTKRALRALAAGVNDTEGQFRDLQEIIDSSGESLKAFEKMAGSYDFKIKKLKSGMKNFGTVVGQTILMSFSALLKAAGVNIEEFSNLGEQMKKTKQDILANKTSAESLTKVFSSGNETLEEFTNSIYANQKAISKNQKPYYDKMKELEDLRDTLSATLKNYKEIPLMSDLSIHIDTILQPDFKKLMQETDEKMKALGWDMSNLIPADKIEFALKELTKEIDNYYAKIRGADKAQDDLRSLFETIINSQKEIERIKGLDLPPEDEAQKLAKVYKKIRDAMEAMGLQSTGLYDTVKKLHQAQADIVDESLTWEQRLDAAADKTENLANKYKTLGNEAKSENEKRQLQIQSIQAQIDIYENLQKSVEKGGKKYNEVGAIIADLTAKLTNLTGKTKAEININKKLKDILDDIDTKYEAMKIGVSDLNKLRDIEKTKIAAKITKLWGLLDSMSSVTEGYDEIRATIARLEAAMRGLEKTEPPTDWENWLENLKESTQQSADYFDKLYKKMSNGEEFEKSAKSIEKYYAALKKAFGNEAAEKMLLAYGVQYQTIEGLKDAWGNAALYWTDAFNTAYSSISDGLSQITDDVFDGVNMQKKKWGEYFEYIANEFAKMLTKMAIELAAKKALFEFLDILFPGSGSVGNVFLNDLKDFKLGDFSTTGGNPTPNVSGANTFSAGGGFNDGNIVNRLNAVETAIRGLNMNPNINVQPTMRFSRRDLAFISKEGGDLNNATRL
jgi:TP901 family phage tail tape measure protein